MDPRLIHLHVGHMDSQLACSRFGWVRPEHRLRDPSAKYALVLKVYKPAVCISEGEMRTVELKRNADSNLYLALGFYLVEGDAFGANEGNNKVIEYFGVYSPLRVAFSNKQLFRNAALNFAVSARHASRTSSHKANTIT